MTYTANHPVTGRTGRTYHVAGPDLVASEDGVEVSRLTYRDEDAAMSELAGIALALPRTNAVAIRALGLV